MARPSKKEIDKRNKIIELGIFKRDSKIYTSFENLFENENKYSAAYYFCEESFSRSEQFGTHEKKLRLEELKDFYDVDFYNSQKILINRLSEINSKSAKYYDTLLCCCYFDKSGTWDKAYTNMHYEFITIELNILIKAIGTKRAYILAESSDLVLSSMMDSTKENSLTKDEKLKLLNTLEKQIGGGWKTIVERITTPHFPEEIADTNMNKSVYAELDLTKPKEEILEYVSQLKDDFDEDPIKFPNAYELLGEIHEPFMCDLNNCDVLKEKNPKPMSGRLADILFIYDCKKVGLHDDYIKDEIDRYWNDVKNLYTDKFSSVSDYYNIAKEYIDNKKYVDYLTGIKKTPL